MWHLGNHWVTVSGMTKLLLKRLSALVMAASILVAAVACTETTVGAASPSPVDTLTVVTTTTPPQVTVTSTTAVVAMVTVKETVAFDSSARLCGLWMAEYQRSGLKDATLASRTESNEIAGAKLIIAIEKYQASASDLSNRSVQAEERPVAALIVLFNLKLSEAKKASVSAEGIAAVATTGYSLWYACTGEMLGE